MPQIATSGTLLIPVSVGELIDKITILQIKTQRLRDAAKLANVQTELAALEAVWAASGLSKAAIAADWDALFAVNAGLWDVEDAKRAKEAQQSFDADFIALARRVYFENDQRAAIKRRINMTLGSHIVEEKSYAGYN